MGSALEGDVILDMLNLPALLNDGIGHEALPGFCSTASCQSHARACPLFDLHGVAACTALDLGPSIAGERRLACLCQWRCGAVFAAHYHGFGSSSSMGFCRGSKRTICYARGIAIVAAGSMRSQAIRTEKLTLLGHEPEAPVSK